MNKERLLNVAKALRESPNPEKFTMCQVHRCGTPACAIGHYATRRDLQEAFQLPTRKYESVGHEFSPVNAVLVGVWGATRPADGWDNTVAKHFGIPLANVDQLFGYDGCASAGTAIAAAEYIERFVAERSV